MIKSLLKILLLLFLIFPLFFPKPAYAQILMGPWYDQSFPQWFVKVYENSNPQEIFGERYTAAQVQWIFYSIVQLIPIPKRLVACAMTADFSGCVSEVGNMFRIVSTDAVPMNERSIAERIENAATTLATIISDDRPISGFGHMRTSIAKINAPEVFAQNTEGTGFRGLSTVRSLWQASRDVTYVLMVLVIIVMAFMIMFRMQLPSKAVITVQSSLWNVFMALILITFSYAIAGFAIDLMYITIGLISIIFTQTGVMVASGNPTLVIYRALTEGPTLGVPAGLIGFMIGYMQTFFNVLAFIIFSPSSDLAQAPSALGIAGAVVISGLISTVVTIVLAIILLFMFIKVSWMLIKTFVNILILTIIGPFKILIGTAFPGMGGFKGWFTSLLTNLAVYPTVGLLFLMSYIFLSGAYYIDSNDWAQAFTSLSNIFTNGNGFMISSFGFGVNRNLFVQSGQVVSTWSPPMTFGGFISFLWLFASFACISMIPKTTELVQSLLSGKQFAMSTAIGQAVMVPGVTAIKETAQDYGKGFRAGVTSYTLGSISEGTKFRLGEALKQGSTTARSVFDKRFRN